MLIFLLFSITSAATISGEVIPPKLPAEKKQWQGSSVKVHLSSSKVTYLTDSNNFNFYNIPDGVYLLEVHDKVFVYKPIIAKVSGDSVTYKEQNVLSAEKPLNSLRIPAEKKIVYFEERETFSISSILFNPMVMIFVLMSLLAFCMPKNKMDPEQLKEMQELTKQYNSNSWMSSFLQPPSFD